MSALSLASTGSTVQPRLVAFAVTCSADNRAAFDWACANLMLPDDIVVLVHAYSRNRMFAGTQSAAGARLISHFEVLLNQRGFLNYRINQREGAPVDVICQAVLAHGCDMCIVGGRRTNMLKRAVFGSVRAHTRIYPGVHHCHSSVCAACVQSRS